MTLNGPGTHKHPLARLKLYFPAEQPNRRQLGQRAAVGVPVEAPELGLLHRPQHHHAAWVRTAIAGVHAGHAVQVLLLGVAAGLLADGGAASHVQGQVRRLLTLDFGCGREHKACSLRHDMPVNLPAKGLVQLDANRSRVGVGAAPIAPGGRHGSTP